MKPGKGRRRSGATIVEFALVVPILIAIMLAVMEAGWLIKNNMQVANGAREGARAASIGKSTANVKALVAKRAAPLEVTTTVQHTVEDKTYDTKDSGLANDAPAGALVRVTVRHRHKPLTGFFPFLRNRTVMAKAEFGRE